MSTGNDNRLSKNERRQQAREQAKAARETQQKKERRNRFLLQGGVLAAIIAVAVIVTLVIVQSVKPEGPGPKNMASGGAVFTSQTTVAETKALKAGEEPVPTKVDRSKPPLDIVIYADYACSHCVDFEETNQALLDGLLESGEATVEYHPVAFVDPNSTGRSGFSSTASNAFACVVNYSPENAWKYNALLYSKEVLDKRAGSSLTTDQYTELAEQAGVRNTTTVANCIKNESFKGFLLGETQRAQTGPIPNLAEGTELPNISGTPTVLVNGVQYKAANDPKYTSFKDFVYKQLAEVQGVQPTG